MNCDLCLQRMKVLELFSGYGTASFALKRIFGEDGYECVGYSDIDKYANQCFAQNHKGKELGDVKNVDPNNLQDFDLLTGGFPCQAFSVAGKGLGESDPRGTLFYEIIRIAEIKKPKYMLLENVKGLTSKKFTETFDKILSELNRIGYKVHWELLNTKDYGIPQNRERVWFVCFRNDVDDSHFDYPKKEELKLFLKDILEDEVDEKYYLNEKQMNKIINSNFMQEKLRIQKTDVCSSLLARDYKDPKCIQINKPLHSNNRVYSDEGLSPKLNTMQGGHRQPFIYVKNATKKGYLEAYEGDGVNLEQTNSKTRRGRVQEKLAPTLQCNDARGVIEKDMRIRKLTPKECFRLQGFLNDEVNLDGLSNTQQYKLAGNGQSVNVVEKIMRRMFVKDED
jgi:DNA (cytosine-5)-methyltransferase 1